MQRDESQATTPYEYESALFHLRERHNAQLIWTQPTQTRTDSCQVGNNNNSLGGWLHEQIISEYARAFVVATRGTTRRQASNEQCS